MTDDAQDVAEDLDDDMTAGDDRGADDQETYDPPDEPLVVDRGGDEAEPDQVAETFAERTARLEPEDTADGEDPDDLGSLVGDAGSLDDEPDLVGRATGPTSGPVSAEEAALHLTRDPPMRPLGDGYVAPAEG